MSKLILLGCSLTAQGHLKSWGDQVSEVLGLDTINLAVPACANQLQMQRFKDYVLETGIAPDDIIIWEITGTNRVYFRKKLGFFERLKDSLPGVGNILFTSKRKNYFDNAYRSEALCSHPEHRNAQMDEEQVLEDILFFLTVAKQFTKNLIVVIGWKKAIPPRYYKKFIALLERHNLNYIKQPILEHSIENNLPLLDDIHPTEVGYISFANNCVIPKMKELGLV